jgi:hypothetical protein
VPRPGRENLAPMTADRSLIARLAAQGSSGAVHAHVSRFPTQCSSPNPPAGTRQARPSRRGGSAQPTGGVGGRPACFLVQSVHQWAGR